LYFGKSGEGNSGVSTAAEHYPLAPVWIRFCPRGKGHEWSGEGKRIKERLGMAGTVPFCRLDFIPRGKPARRDGS